MKKIKTIFLVVFISFFNFSVYSQAITGITFNDHSGSFYQKDSIPLLRSGNLSVSFTVQGAPQPLDYIWAWYKGSTMVTYGTKKLMYERGGLPLVVPELPIGGGLAQGVIEIPWGYTKDQRFFNDMQPAGPYVLKLWVGVEGVLRNNYPSAPTNFLASYSETIKVINRPYVFWIPGHRMLRAGDTAVGYIIRTGSVSKMETFQLTGEGIAQLSLNSISISANSTSSSEIPIKISENSGTGRVNVLCLENGIGFVSPEMESSKSYSSELQNQNPQGQDEITRISDKFCYSKTTVISPTDKGFRLFLCGKCVKKDQGFPRHAECSKILGWGVNRAGWWVKKYICKVHPNYLCNVHSKFFVYGPRIKMDDPTVILRCGSTSWKFGGDVQINGKYFQVKVGGSKTDKENSFMMCCKLKLLPAGGGYVESCN